MCEVTTIPTRTECEAHRSPSICTECSSLTAVANDELLLSMIAMEAAMTDRQTSHRARRKNTSEFSMSCTRM
jgi:hypothetical protein